ncbi:glycosyltransferase family 4 protein [Aestuariibaculum marinum]|uniref:Glycosyltransferase family 4 protein n=1 Tax=Aestuariibaculum marinum TaxID=2683592 RepID=A0A8J6U413_9FLAO|nr:glycosyltransferase family 4 protein [Aestuariibaculum marinum]MBD0823885.1 glycosyltransferase family 4 protein [Aestuariibaculum marinum]
MKQLTIISHTEHYRNADGKLVGFGATVTEINNLLDIFDSIVHVAVLYDTEVPSSALPYQSEAIRFIALPVVGGKSLKDKFQVLLKAPEILRTIRHSLKGSTHFQFRAPTGMGVYVIPYLMFFCSKSGWFKYAGNWKQEHAPLAYRFQKWLLTNQNRKVTINGHWENQPKHCISFENPCLTEQELRDGMFVRREKRLNHKRLALCFVGRLEAAKGFDLFLESLNALPEDFKDRIDTVHMVGEMRDDGLKNDVIIPGVSVAYHGTLPRHELHDIYRQSHFIVLPSKSEGFPKVISEALNFGCVPVVSNVSAIGQYIENGKHGVLIEELTQACLVSKLEECINMDINKFKSLITQQGPFYHQFSYKHYNQRILKEVLAKL